MKHRGRGTVLLAVVLCVLQGRPAGASSRLSGSRVLRTREQKIEDALARARQEQEIEDYNSFQRCEGSLHRRMICLPLTEHFDPPPGIQGHGKLQVSDRVSLPKELMTGVLKRKPEPPWQFEVRAIRDQDEDDARETDDAEEGGRERKSSSHTEKQLDKLYCHVLDWQAPRNYVFIPRWMMKTLGLKARDVVEFTWVRLREGGQITLKPLTRDFVNWANPQAVMESELKYYSSLTVGSTILIDYKGSKHALEVVRVTDGDQQLDGANIQDVNIAVDFEGVPASKKPKSTPPGLGARDNAAAVEDGVAAEGTLDGADADDESTKNTSEEEDGE